MIDETAISGRVVCDLDCVDITSMLKEARKTVWCVMVRALGWEVYNAETGGLSQTG